MTIKTYNENDELLFSLKINPNLKTIITTSETKICVYHMTKENDTFYWVGKYEVCED